MVVVMFIMKSKIVLPADVYVVANKTIVSEEEKKLISMLYQPIIGCLATTLYLTFLDDLRQSTFISDDLTHHHLMSKMQIKLDDIIIARKKLEAVGLIKTYIKEDSVNSYVYILFSPLSANEFFNHPILNIVLYNNVGKSEYDRIINCFKVPKLILKEYTDVTSKFDEVFTSSKFSPFEEHKNIIKNSKNAINFMNTIDFDLLVSSIPNSMFNNRELTKEIKDLINSLSYIYNIDDLSMQVLVRNSLTERGSVDRNLLRKSCRDFYQFENNGKLPTLVYSIQPDYLKQPQGDQSKRGKMLHMFETITPYDYLKSKYNGVEPTSRDLRMIENLMIDQQLKAGVLNVLIYYVLKINNQKLNKNYIETIAGQWKRLKIETVEAAMSFVEKEYRKNTKVSNKTSVTTVKKKNVSDVPDWFDKDNKIEISSKEAEEDMKKILQELV